MADAIAWRMTSGPDAVILMVHGCRSVHIETRDGEVKAIGFMWDDEDQAREDSFVNTIHFEQHGYVLFTGPGVRTLTNAESQAISEVCDSDWYMPLPPVLDDLFNTKGWHRA